MLSSDSVMDYNRMQPGWVFGYGSLMWNPGFAFVRQSKGEVQGYHRRLCVRSYDHRGNRGKPGVVFGLDLGGTCTGMVFAVAEEDWPATLAYLRRREQVSLVYQEIILPVRLVTGQMVSALSYVVDQAHPDYAGDLSHDTLLGLVAQAHGQSGSNRDYVVRTAEQLHMIGIADPALERLAQALAGERVG